ncbi:MAG: hypothetical protein ACJAZN_002882 [Planctomycetota bacterium]|jgi:hypothetical protein
MLGGCGALADPPGDRGPRSGFSRPGRLRRPGGCNDGLRGGRLAHAAGGSPAEPRACQRRSELFPCRARSRRDGVVSRAVLATLDLSCRAKLPPCLGSLARTRRVGTWLAGAGGRPVGALGEHGHGELLDPCSGIWLVPLLGPQLPVRRGPRLTGRTARFRWKGQLPGTQLGSRR